MTVALVERKLFGGTCVNTGCMPTKTLVASAYAAHLARRGADYGVVIGGAGARRHGAGQGARRRGRRPTSRSRRRDVAARHAAAARSSRGTPASSGPTRVRVGDELLTAPRIFINVGGRALRARSARRRRRAVPDQHHDPRARSRAASTWSSSAAATSGLEFAQMYRRFGAEVTVVEKGPRLIAREDEDVSDAIREILEARGHRRPHRRRVHRARGRTRDGVACRRRLRGRRARASSARTCCSPSAGARTPTTSGSDEAGVATDARGYITVDDSLATNVPGIWALGDCNGRGAFTHTAYNDFEIVAANLLDGEHAQRQRPHPGLRALHRSAARPRRA